MPITIDNEEFEFDLLVSTIAAGKVEPEFNLFLDVNDALVIYPVKFEIKVEPKEEEQLPQTAPTQNSVEQGQQNQEEKKPKQGEQDQASPN